MTDYAPEAILEAFAYLDAELPELGLQLSGVLGDAQHYSEGGYHVPRAYLAAHFPGDYSIELPADKLGDAHAASALDVKPKNAAGMVTMTKRLIAGVERGDVRLRPLREFFGTVNGSSVTGRDVASKRVVTADTSHLWHLHLSGLRKYANDAAAWRGIMDVIAGKPIEEGFTVQKADEDTIRGIVREEISNQLAHIWDSATGTEHGIDWIVETALNPVKAQLAEIAAKLPAPAAKPAAAATKPAATS